jgi:hypothetical protein
MTKCSAFGLVVSLGLGAFIAASCGSDEDTGNGAIGSDASTSGNTGGGSSGTAGDQSTGNAGGLSGSENAGGSANTGGSANAGGSANTGGSANGGSANTGGSAQTGGAAGKGGASGSSMTDARSPDAPQSMPDASVNPTDSGATTTPSVGGCGLFPANDPWNQAIAANATVDANWTAKLVQYATKTVLHPDFGSTFGIPYNVVPMNQATLPITFDYPDDSDPGPYPFPGATAKIEGGSPAACSGDCHVLCLVQGSCLLYEGWDCHYNAGGTSWHCGSGAEFDLSKVSAGARPQGWTSADAAGLAILPGLVRYDEVAAGVVKHAIRFTYHCTQDGFVYPASHQAVPAYPYGCPQNIATGTLEAEYPPMGLRIRLKAGYDISGLSAQAKVVAQAMKTYGMILADNGSDYYFQGDPNPGWNDNQVNDLKNIPADQFEVIGPVGPITR